MDDESIWAIVDGKGTRVNHFTIRGCYSILAMQELRYLHLDSTRVKILGGGESRVNSQVRKIVYADCFKDHFTTSLWIQPF